MIAKRWCTVGVFTVCSLGMFAPSDVRAQHGPGRLQQDSQSQPGPRQQQGPAYDTAAQSTVNRTVENVRDIARRPLVSSSETEARGFWTKKRVLVAALVVKAAVVAALLLR